MVVTDGMVIEACKAWHRCGLRGFSNSGEENAMRAALEAALAQQAQPEMPRRIPPCGNAEPHETHRLIWQFEDPGPPWCPGIKA